MRVLIKKYYQTGLLVVVLLMGLGIRLYDLTDPPLDFHLTRQLRSAIIARSVYYSLTSDSGSEARPQTQNLAQLEIYEPPILEQIVAMTYVLIGSEQVWVARIWNSLFWLIGGLALYCLARRMASFWSSIAGLGFYLFLPFGVIASRSFQPDPWMVMWILMSAWSLVRWGEELQAPNEQRSRRALWKWTVAAGFCGGIAVLVKIFAIFFIEAMVLMVVSRVFWENRQLHRPSLRGNLFSKKSALEIPALPVLGMAVFTLTPALVYYLILNPDRSGSFFSFWVVGLSKLLLSSSFYAKWLAMIGGLIGLSVLMAALLGVLLAPAGIRYLLIGLWVGYGLFGFSSPYQFITHEYYHLALVGLVGLSLPPLLEVIFQKIGQQNKIWMMAAAFVFLFTAGYSIWVARSQLYAVDYRSEPAAWKRIGDAIPVDRSFIALTADYGMRLRYFGWRTMADQWPSSADLSLFNLAGNDPMDYQKRFTELTEGKDLFVVTAFNELDSQPQLRQLLEKNYPVLAKGDGYIIYQLRTR